MNLGIDTHTRYTQVAVVVHDGNLQDESRIPNDQLKQLAEQYAGIDVAIEASGNYRPIYKVLNEHLTVTLANGSKNRLIADATVKTDRLDAKRLAHILRSGMLAESYVPTDEIPQFVDLVRTRKGLVDERTDEKNRVRAVLKRTENAYDSELFGPNGREFLAELSLSNANRTIIETHLSVTDEYDAQVASLEDEIERHVLESPAAHSIL